MKEKISKYLDDLFSDVPGTKQLDELKEEIGANLVEKIDEFLKSGQNKDQAWQKAIAGLGDMTEFIDDLRKGAATRNPRPPHGHRHRHGGNGYRHELDKKHIIGFVMATAIILFGALLGGLIYLRDNDILTTMLWFTPFALVSITAFIYLGLTLDSPHDYPMNDRRAFMYSVSFIVGATGLSVGAWLYLQNAGLPGVFLAAAPFVFISVIAFTWLGLTEKSRRKMDSDWEKHWIEYYSNPRQMLLRGSLSGALWIFSFAAFFIVAFTLGWKFSWIVFVIAIGIETLLEAFFACKRSENRKKN